VKFLNSPQIETSDKTSTVATIICTDIFVFFTSNESVKAKTPIIIECKVISVDQIDVLSVNDLLKYSECTSSKMLSISSVIFLVL